MGIGAVSESIDPCSNVSAYVYLAFKTGGIAGAWRSLPSFVGFNEKLLGVASESSDIL